MADTILYSYVAVCDSCKKGYFSIKDNGVVNCPFCKSVLTFERLPHRLLISKEKGIVVSQVTERVAGSNVFNKHLSLKSTFEDTLALLSEKRFE